MQTRNFRTGIALLTALVTVWARMPARAAAPTDIALSNSSINENNAVNATIGTLSATDADGGPFTFALFDAAGFPDNTAFNISGDSLRASEKFNFETKPTYSIRIRVTDPNSNSYDETLTISVSDNPAEVAPTIADQTLSIQENSAAASCHGIVAATDPDGDSFTYAIVPNSGQNPEGLFTINPATGQICIINNATIAATYLDTERALDPAADPQPPYELEIRVTDRDGRADNATTRT